MPITDTGPPDARATDSPKSINQLVASTPPGLILRDLRLDYDGQPLLFIAHETIAGGRTTCLLGPSGVGKTSLLRAIAGLLKPASGTVTATDRQPLTNRLAYMPQSDCLMPWLSVLQNVVLGKRLRGERITAGDRERAEFLLQQVGLADKAGRLPNTLSGGEKQRTALARVLFEDRAIVLMDEPFSALDAITRSELQALGAELLAGRTVILITHDPLEAIRLSHDIRILSGHPARLGTAITLDGAPPRSSDSAAIWQHHEQLMTALQAS